jgi:hypothetical protein
MRIGAVGEENLQACALEGVNKVLWEIIHIKIESSIQSLPKGTGRGASTHTKTSPIASAGTSISQHLARNLFTLPNNQAEP